MEFLGIMDKVLREMWWRHQVENQDYLSASTKWWQKLCGYLLKRNLL